jgi:hypothetical protein
VSTNDELFRSVRTWTAANYAGLTAASIAIVLSNGERVRLPVPVGATAATSSPDDEVFVPTKFQQRIIEALAGKALHADALAVAVGQEARQSLYRKPGGIGELLEHGYVKKHSRLGYYDPTDPPPELSQSESNSQDTTP